MSSLLTIGGSGTSYGYEPLTDITNGNETPRTTNQRTKVTKNDFSYAPKKTNLNESPPHLSATGRRLQFEDENTLQAIPIKGSKGSQSLTQRKILNEEMNTPPPPNEMNDRSKCVRKKYQKEVTYSSLFLPDVLFSLYLYL